MYDLYCSFTIFLFNEEIAFLKNRIAAAEEKITTQQQTIENMAALMDSMEQRIIALEN